MNPDELLVKMVCTETEGKIKKKSNVDRKRYILWRIFESIFKDV